MCFEALHVGRNELDVSFEERRGPLKNSGFLIFNPDLCAGLFISPTA